MFLAACVQLNGTSDIEKNLATTERLVRQAAEKGAVLVATPENTPFLGPHQKKVELAETLDGPTNQRLAALANELDIHLLVGSSAEIARGEEGQRCFNTSLLFGPDGGLLAHYRKLHLFDVDVSDEVRFQESATIVPGDDVVVADTALGKIGLSICYDLRFPELYRAQVDKGAEILTVPSAFTHLTGQFHWHTLLRARAIECQAFVLAPGQTGHHDDRGLRHSYGHSLIIDPWGRVTAELPEKEGICMAEIDIDRVRSVRKSMPVQTHRRLT